jgi:hypothetical protein
MISRQPQLLPWRTHSDEEHMCGGIINGLHYGFILIRRKVPIAGTGYCEAWVGGLYTTRRFFRYARTTPEKVDGQAFIGEALAKPGEEVSAIYIGMESQAEKSTSQMNAYAIGKNES